MRVLLISLLLFLGAVSDSYAVEHTSVVGHRYAIEQWNYGVAEDNEAIRKANQLLAALTVDIEASLVDQINLEAPDATYLQSFKVLAPQTEPSPMSIGDVKKRWIEQNTLQIIQATAFKQGDKTIWNSWIYVGSLGSTIKKEQFRLVINIDGDSYNQAAEEVKLFVAFSLIEDALALPSSQAPSGQQTQVLCGLVTVSEKSIRNLIRLGVLQTPSLGADPFQGVTAIDPDFDVGPQIVKEIGALRSQRQCS